MDTIFALASGRGRAGVAVWRLSGPGAGPALQALAGRLPPPRHARLTTLRHDGETIDQALVLWFPGPNSFTGEDVVELHGHGGRAVAQALTDALLALGLRPAEPGEFSRRAVLNGRMDLTQAESIADLVDADTAAQRRQALRQGEGALSRLVEGWRAELVSALAHLEAVIDFADEGVPDSLINKVSADCARLAADMGKALADGGRGETLRDGIHIAILGAPNVGKSSLLNRIAGREAAIVSATAGTTRDVIEVHLDLGGWPVVLADTAGLRDTECDVEAEGIRRARARADSADLKLVVFDATSPDDAHTRDIVDEQALVVLNKCDLGDAEMAGAIRVSARDGDGIDLLLARLEEEVAARMESGEAPVITRARHRSAIEACRSALLRFDASAPTELAAEDLRLAARELGRITGRVDVEELLDVIFREFCIGK
jgi:tRNA modification GTPase